MKRVVTFLVAVVAVAVLPATADACVIAIVTPAPNSTIPPTPVRPPTLTSQQEVEGVLLVADIVFQGKAVTIIPNRNEAGGRQTGATLAPTIVWKGNLLSLVDVLLPPVPPVSDCDLLFGTRVPFVDVTFLPNLEYLVYAHRLNDGTYEALPRTTTVYAGSRDLAILGPGTVVTAPTPVISISTSVANTPSVTVPPPPTAADSGPRYRPLLFIVSGGLVGAGALLGVRLTRRRRARRL